MIHNYKLYAQYIVHFKVYVVYCTICTMKYIITDKYPYTIQGMYPI